MCDDYVDTPSFWHSTWRKARKEHQCFACYEPIRPGDLYRNSCGKWDDFQSVKHCARCWNIFLTLQDLSLGEAIDLALDCGLEPLDPSEHPETQYLAFQLPEEAQTFAARQKQRELQPRTS